jgi:hypothetical protein
MIRAGPLDPMRIRTYARSPSGSSRTRIFERALLRSVRVAPCVRPRCVSREDQGSTVGRRKLVERRSNGTGFLRLQRGRLGRRLVASLEEVGRVAIGDRHPPGPAGCQVARHSLEPGRHVVRGPPGPDLELEPQICLLNEVLGHTRVACRCEKAAEEQTAVSRVGRLDDHLDPSVAGDSAGHHGRWV